ncbi:hypothetical protein CIP107507_00811 [Corynebacterium diphtheriae]|nr:hypothetical protein CIP107507_00811 [Corynebacterium diphtheriae]
MITVYHNPRCSTSRKALEYIEQHSDDEVTIIRYLDTPPSEADLATSNSVHNTLQQYAP